MQFYQGSATVSAPASSFNACQHREYLCPPASVSPQLNWNLAPPQGEQWDYDFTSQYHSFNPPALHPRNSPYPANCVGASGSSISALGTPHNIRDILGAQQHTTLLQDETARTSYSYQQNPTSIASTEFSHSHSASLHTHSASLHTHSASLHTHSASLHTHSASLHTHNSPFSADAAVAQSFYLPSVPRPGRHSKQTCPFHSPCGGFSPSFFLSFKKIDLFV